MKIPFKLLPLIDFWRIHKFRGFLFPLLCGLTALFYGQNSPAKDLDYFHSFVAIQIGIDAVLISFSLAFMGILCSSSNSSLQLLRRRKNSISGVFQKLDDNDLSMFQILLSGVGYNITIEIFYLALLSVQSLLPETLIQSGAKYLIALNIFYLAHIIGGLLKSATRFYLIVWSSND